ncbi:uncharacterized protein CBL_11259 [Carabus blaptoides fortunei]
MNNALISFVIFTFQFYSVVGDLEFYPGYRRPDSLLKWNNEQNSERYALERLTQYLQDQQRRLALQLDPGPEFTFRLPDRSIDPEDTDFAIAPPDPRYYLPAPEDYDFLENDLDNEEFDEEERIQQALLNPQPRIRQQDLQLQQPQSQDPLRQQRQQQQHEEQQDEESTIINPVVQIRSEDAHPVPAVHHIREQNLDLLPSGVHPHKDRTIEVVPVKNAQQDESAGVYIIAVVAGISAAASVALIAFGIGWYNLQKNVKNASDVEYPAYGVTGPNKDVSPTGDRRLAQSAQMYHYQHQKQQIIAMESRAAATVRHGSMSEAESDEENEEGDYTVYECPGLAPTGEMEVKNPLFQDDPTPAGHTPAKDAIVPLSDQK